jgi:hypothetical protein
MYSFLESANLLFKADYSQEALKARQALRVEWAKGNYPCDAFLQKIKDDKREILTRINKDILKLSPAFAQALTALSTRNKPKLIDQRRWNRVLLNLTDFLKGNPPCLYEISNKGWAVTDVFGCHAEAPQSRIDCMGLLLLVKGGEVIEVSRECITSKTEGGARLTYRRPWLMPPGQTTLDLLPEEE